jgi:hypothetical protein
LPVILGSAFTVLYALFPSKMHFVDGVGYAWDIENLHMSYEWHPHHPIWLPIMHMLFHTVKLVFPSLRSIAFLSFLNAILGGLSIILLVNLIRKLCRNMGIALLAGLFIGVSWGMMQYCCDVNIYMIEIVILLGIIHILISQDILTFRSALLSTFLVLLACLIHQMAFFFSIVVLIGIIVRMPAGQKFKTAILCAITYAVLITLLNLVVYLVAKPLVEIEMNVSFMEWLTAYGSNPSWWTIAEEGFSRAQAIFHISQVNLFFHTPNADAIYYDSHFNDPAVFRPVYTIFHVLVSGFILWEIIDLFRTRKRNSTFRQCRIILVSWFMIYFLFNQVYCAFEIHYKMFYLFPFLMLIAFRLNEINQRILKPLMVVLTLAACFIGVWNFETAMYPNSKPETNSNLRYALELSSITQPGDLVIFSRQQYYISWLFKYYSKADGVPFRYKFNRFASKEEGFLEIDRQTVEYFNSRYQRIFLTGHASQAKPRQWYFSGYFFLPPHPDLMALHPSSFIRKDEIRTENGEILQQVELAPSLRYRTSEK